MGASAHAYIVAALGSADGGWPDALSVAPLAASRSRPILLVTRDTVPESTRRALARHGTRFATVIGGEAVLSESVVQQLRRDDVSVTRLAGPDRYATSAVLFDEAIRLGMSSSRVWLTTGRNWPDALAAGPVVAMGGHLMLLVDGADLTSSPASRARLVDNRDGIEQIRVLGGVGAVSQQVVSQVEALFGP
jgi:hypothetical protein